MKQTSKRVYLALFIYKPRNLQSVRTDLWSQPGRTGVERAGFPSEGPAQ